MMKEFLKKINQKKDINRTIMIVISAFVYSIAITNFSKVGGIYPGGFAGISRIIVDVCEKYFHYEIPFGLLYFIMNIGPTYLVFRFIGKRFTIYSILQYTLVSFFTGIIPRVIVLSDPLLIAIFGGLIHGLGIGIALRNNASSGGTDFIAIYVSNKYNRPIWNYVMIVNGIVLTVAGMIFGWDRAMYSIIYQFVSTQVVKQLHERYRMETLTIVTKKPDEVVTSILKGTRHGITEIKSHGAYSDTDNTLLYTVINSFQRHQVVKSILDADPKAFINVQETTMIVGNYYQLPLD